MRRIRSAFTLIELAVVLAILGVSGAAMGMLLIRQQRFYRGASELLYARQGVRDALDVLAGDLRGMAVADTVRLLADSAIEMYTAIGSSVVCQATSGQEIGLPPVTPAGNTLTAFATEPDTGDLALFYRAIDGNGFWEPHRVSAFARRALSAACPVSTGFARTEDDANAQGFQATLGSPLSGDVHSGTPVQFVRRGRYSLYRSSDGQWYLGYRRCNALGESVCGPIQPLSGPYRPYSADHRTTGLLFEYFDRDGARLTGSSPRLELARVDVTARAQSRQSLSVEGRSFRPADSGTIAIAIRNRLP